MPTIYNRYTPWLGALPSASLGSKHKRRIFSMPDKAVSAASVEALRTDMIAFINKRFDDLVAPLDATPTAPRYKMPTLNDGRDPRNKNGHNLTDRGVELLYRMFDD